MRQQGISAAPASPLPGSQAESAALSIRIRTLEIRPRHGQQTILGQKSRMNQSLHRCMMHGFMHRMMLCRGEDGPMVGWMNRSDDVWTDSRMDEGITGE